MLTNHRLGPVHTYSFSNENGAVLLRFQKDLPPHLSFSYRFRPSTLQRRIRLKTLLYPQCAYSSELDACAFQYNMEPSVRSSVRHFGYSRRVGWRPVVSIWMTSPFSDFITVHTRKQRFQKASFSNRFTLESVFE